MGLDSVELVMEFEDEFKVTFSDAVAERCRTVNEVAMYIYGQIQSRPEIGAESCPSSRRFYELRRSLVGLTPIDPESIRPDTRIVEALPRRIRRRVWGQAGLSLPKLQLPAWARWVIGLSGLAVFIAVMGFFVAVHVDAWSGMVLAIAIASFAMLVLFLLQWPARRELPDDIVTMADLVRRSLRTDRNAGRPIAGEPSFAEVVQRIREITAAQLGLPIEKVLPESHFVRDLHID